MGLLFGYQLLVVWLLSVDYLLAACWFCVSCVFDDGGYVLAICYVLVMCGLRVCYVLMMCWLSDGCVLVECWWLAGYMLVRCWLCVG